MQAYHGEQHSGMLLHDGVHGSAFGRIDVGQQHPVDTGGLRAGDYVFFLAGEGFIGDMGMRVHEMHIRKFTNFSC